MQHNDAGDWTTGYARGHQHYSATFESWVREGNYQAADAYSMSIGVHARNRLEDDYDRDLYDEGWYSGCQAAAMTYIKMRFNWDD